MLRTDSISMQVSLVKNFSTIQKKVEAILNTEKLDVKQISDLERYVGMQDSIIVSLDRLHDISKL